MAYKSRVTNKYMGSTFAGRVNAATSTDATDLINILQKDVNPAISRIMLKEVQNKKDEAVQEINQLLTTRDADTVQKEILEGKHPNLNNKYVQKTVQYHTGRHQAIDAITQIEANKDKYDFQTTNLPAFYKEYLPSFADKDGSYALGFAAVFNNYKAKDAIKDAKVRSDFAQTEKLKEGAKIVSRTEPEDFWKEVNSLHTPLPPEEGGTVRRYLYTNKEANDAALLFLNNAIDGAASTADLAKIEDIINMDRGVGEGGNQLGSLRSVKNNADIAKVIEAYETKNRTLANAEYTASVRATETDKKERIENIFSIDRSTVEGELEYQTQVKDAVKAHPSLNITLNSIAKNNLELFEDQNKVANIQIDIMNGLYNNNENGLLEAYRDASNNPETLVLLNKMLVDAKTREANAYTPPFQEKAFTNTVGKINKIIVDLVPAVDKKYNSQKNQYVSDLIQQEMQKDYMEWLSQNPRPLKLADASEKDAWNLKQQEFFTKTYNEKIQTYSNQTWLNGLADRINKEGIDLTSSIDLDDIVVEYYESNVASAVEDFKPFATQITSQAEASLLSPVTVMMESADFQRLLNTKGFENFKTDKVAQQSLAERLIKDLEIENTDYTDQINQVIDNINENIQTFELPKIETYTPLGLFEKGDSVEAQQNFFVDTLEQLTGRPITKDLYNRVLSEDAKLNLAKAFNISSVQLNELVSEYLK
jgi:hypothetical protein